MISRLLGIRSALRKLFTDMFDFHLYTSAVEKASGVAIEPAALKREVMEFLIQNPLADALAVAKGFERRSPAEDIQLLLSASDQCIREGSGFSFIRMGDGEGRFVGEIRNLYPAIYRFSLALSKNIWFGFSESIPTDDFFATLSDCYKNASIVGYSPQFRVDLEFKNIWYGYVGCVNGNNFLREEFNGGVDRSVRNWSNVGLFSHDKFIEMLRKSDVTIITCHPKEELAKSGIPFGLLRVINIPPEKNTGLVNYCPNQSLYPKLFGEIMVDVANNQSSVVLTSAGVYSKFFCERARSAGKVAFDIGAELDKRLGFKTRT